MKQIRFPLQKHYPREIYFGSECYKIKFKKNLDCFGITDSGEKTVTIKDGLSPRQLFKTVVHELCHIIEFERPLKLKHSIIYKLEKAISQIIMDNFL